MPGTARILKGELSIAIYIKLNKSQIQPDGGEGYSGKANRVSVTAFGEEAAPIERGYRKRMGQRTGTESGGPGGTSRQHTVKSSIHHKPGRYTRCLCAERCVFTPGDLPCRPEASLSRLIG